MDGDRAALTSRAGSTTPLCGGGRAISGRVASRGPRGTTEEAEVAPPRGITPTGRTATRPSFTDSRYRAIRHSVPVVSPRCRASSL